MDSMSDNPQEPSVLTSSKVLIVEDEEVIRRGLLAVTSSIPEVTASAVGLASIRDRRMLTEFDVKLISVSTLMNAERAGFVVEHLRPMIVIVPAAQPRQLEFATQRYANGYIMQAELTSSSLRTAILQVVNGQLAVPSTVATYLLNRVRGSNPILSHLKPREAEVLVLLVAGASNKEIASKLCISIHGAKRHVSSLLGKFNSPNRAHLVAYVLRNGMVPLTDPNA